MINKEYVKVAMWLLVGVIAGCVLTKTFTSVRRVENTPVHTQETTKITSESTLKVTPKTSESDPDLVVSNKYVAKINGEYVEAPVQTTKDTSTAVVSTTVDVTPLVKQMTPKWEAGVGVGCVDKEILPCVTLQRNYKEDKAVEAVIQMDDHGKVKGASVIHKWRF